MSSCAELERDLPLLAAKVGEKIELQQLEDPNLEPFRKRLQSCEQLCHQLGRAITAHEIREIEFQYWDSVGNRYAYSEQISTVEKYYQEFCEWKHWMNIVCGWEDPEEVVVGIFIRGLKESIRNEMSSPLPSSLNRAYLEATVIELTLRRMDPWMEKKSEGVDPNPVQDGADLDRELLMQTTKVKEKKHRHESKFEKLDYVSEKLEKIDHMEEVLKRVEAWLSWQAEGVGKIRVWESGEGIREDGGLGRTNLVGVNELKFAEGNDENSGERDNFEIANSDVVVSENKELMEANGVKFTSQVAFVGEPDIAEPEVFTVGEMEEIHADVVPMSRAKIVGDMDKNKEADIKDLELPVIDDAAVLGDPWDIALVVNETVEAIVDEDKLGKAADAEVFSEPKLNESIVALVTSYVEPMDVEEDPIKDDVGHPETKVDDEKLSRVSDIPATAFDRDIRMEVVNDSEDLVTDKEIDGMIFGNLLSTRANLILVLNTLDDCYDGCLEMGFGVGFGTTGVAVLVGGLVEQVEKLIAQKFDMWLLTTVPNLVASFSKFVHTALQKLATSEIGTESSCSLVSCNSSTNSSSTLLTGGRVWTISLNTRGTISDEILRGCFSIRDKNFIYNHLQHAGRVYGPHPKPVRIAIGEAIGSERLHIDEDFTRVIVHHHAFDKTYQPDPLISNQGFSQVEALISEVEAWGFGGTSVKEHSVIKSKLDHFLDDFKLNNLWPELKRVAETIDLNASDHVFHKHIVYVAILVKMGEVWVKSHDGSLLSTRGEKKDFKELLKAKMVPMDEADKVHPSTEKLYCFEKVQWGPQVEQRTNTVVPATSSKLFSDPAIAEELVKSEGLGVEYHCNSCSADCFRKRYHCQKQADFDLGRECYNDGKFGSEMSSFDFILMEPTDTHVLSSEWTDQRTLLLFEALEPFSESWNEIAEHVATKTKAQCILQFVLMPIRDSFLDREDDLKKKLLDNVDPASTSNGAFIPKEALELAEKKSSGNEHRQPSLPLEKTTVKKVVEEVKVCTDIDENFAVKALREAIRTVGLFSTPGEPLRFSEARNPAMVWAAFLAWLVESVAVFGRRIVKRGNVVAVQVLIQWSSQLQPMPLGRNRETSRGICSEIQTLRQGFLKEKGMS